jgi:hypothetical protein
MLDSLFILWYNSIEVEEMVSSYGKRLSKQSCMSIRANEYYFIRKSSVFKECMVLDLEENLIGWYSLKFVRKVFFDIDVEEWE